MVVSDGTRLNHRVVHTSSGGGEEVGSHLIIIALYREIAAIEDLTLDTVHRWLHHTREVLSDLLARTSHSRQSRTARGNGFVKSLGQLGDSER